MKKNLARDDSGPTPFQLTASYTAAEGRVSQNSKRTPSPSLLKNLVENTRSTSLTPYHQLVNSSIGSPLYITSQFDEGLKQNDEATRQRQIKRSEKAFLKENESRSDTIPVFVGDVEREGKLKQVRLSDFKPNTEDLLRPHLDLPSGAAHLGKDEASLHAISSVTNKTNKVDDKNLMEWWTQRQKIRQQRVEDEKLSLFVAFSLHDVVRSTLSTEEAAVIEQIRNEYGRLAGTVAPSTRSSSIHKNPSNEELEGTKRGVVLPYDSLRNIFQKVRVKIYSTTSTVLRMYPSSQIKDNPLDRESVDEEVKEGTLSIVVLLESQEHLREEIQKGNFLPTCVSLPPERILAPCLSYETATSVAMLWKILEQLRRDIPGAAFGLELFEHFILPHIYESFTQYSRMLPTHGGLSEQIAQLASVPLRMESARLAIAAHQQSKEDTQYIEYALKHFTVRDWRRNVHSIRKRDAYVKNTVSLISRLREKRLLQKVFSMWRYEGRNQSNEEYLGNIQHEFVRFITGLESSPATALTEKNEPTCINTRMVATQLASTAFHKRRKKEVESSNLLVNVSGSPNSILRAHPETPKISASQLPGAPTGSKIFLTSGEATSGSSVTFESDAVTQTKDLLASNTGIGGLHLETYPSFQGSPIMSQREHSEIRFPTELHNLQLKAGNTFESMLHKLHEMQEVTNYLREEIGVQFGMLKKVERERDSLRERNKQLEQELLRLTEEKLHSDNLVQEKQFMIQDRDRRIVQLKSRIRAHRNRPWQRVLLRVVGEMCNVSTHISETLDNVRIRQDQKLELVEVSKIASGLGLEEDDELDEDKPYEPSQHNEEERLFGKLAPIVLSSTYPLPDALIILQDWANACLDDLQELDDLKGGVLSTRFTTFSEEARNGILLSRLLFYLSLPRYLQRTANQAQAKTTEEEVSGTNYSDRRRHLLERFNVQLDTPFPVYPEVFGDLLGMRPSDRMSLLLQFASELMAGCDVLSNDTLQVTRQQLYEIIAAKTDLQAPPPACRVELQEVVDPHALALGERASVVTFIALLYTRFAHPFNHKCRQSAEFEKAAILHLLSSGSYHLNMPNEERKQAGDSMAFTEDDLIRHLDDEDKSPWYLFRERCLPVFGTAAHPFLLRGNFWPSDAFESPQLANILGELGMALNRSLQLHRWHVVMSCLVPVMTYSGLSRGVFTGPRASSQALRVGLERAGEWNVPLWCSGLMKVYKRRAEMLASALEGGLVSESQLLPNADLPGQDVLENVKMPPMDEKSGDILSVDIFPGSYVLPSPGKETSPIKNQETAPFTMLSLIEREAKEVMRAIHISSSDLITLFLRRSTLSAELALPTLTLSGWRLLLTDLELLGKSPEAEAKAPLGMDTATNIFVESVMALNDMSNALRSESSNSQGSSEPAEVLPQRSGEKKRITSADGRVSVVSLPKTTNDMTFSGFLVGLTLLSNVIFPIENTLRDIEVLSDLPSALRRFSDGSLMSSHSYSSKKSKSIHVESVTEPIAFTFSLGESLLRLLKTSSIGAAKDVLSDEPRAVIHRLTMGMSTQEVLARYNTAVILVYNAYSKDVYGLAGMEKDDLLQLLRDAMLTSTEISPYLVFEVFQHCSVVRNGDDEEGATRRREIDGKPRDGRRRTPRAVTIVEKPATRSKREIEVLSYEGFIEFLCVLCCFKQPNPLIPFWQRLDVFLRRYVLRPLCQRVQNLATQLNSNKIVSRRAADN